MKKLISLILAAVMLTVMMPSVFAEEGLKSGECGENLTWVLDNGVLTISGMGEMDDWNWEKTPWFDEREDISSVVIEEGVTSIGNRAFHNCKSIKEVTLPKTVTIIGSFAFCGCESLADVTIPEAVTKIGGYAFYGCKNLESITLPKAVTEIGFVVFWECDRLRSIDVESKNEKYSSVDGVLFDKDKTVLLQYPPGRLEKEYEVPLGVTRIEEYAFSDCGNLESVKISGSVTSIGMIAFARCENLTSVTMSEGAKEIEFNAFKDCRNLSNITLPKSVTSISWDVFVGTAYYRDAANWENGALYIGDVLIKVKKFINGEFTIKDGTRCIADQAFYECNRLTDVHIPESVTEIGENAFGKCDNIVSITLPEGVTKISANAFYDCRRLKSIKFPKNVTEIDAGAFAKCTSLTSMTIPESVAKIGSDAFSGCENLSSITLPEGLTEISYGAFWGCKSLESIKIPEGVKEIPGHTFFRCKSLTEIKIPEGVREIGQNAFYGCESMAKITLPEGLTSIGREAFEKTAYYNEEKNWENGALYIASTLIEAEESRSGDLAIKDGTKCIADRAFENCRDLTSVTIPKSVTKIGSDAFYGCDSLSDVYYGGSGEQWDEVNIADFNEPLKKANIHFN